NPRRGTGRLLRARARGRLRGRARVRRGQQRPADDVHHTGRHGARHGRHYARPRRAAPWFELVRRVEGLDGRVRMRWRITPRFGAGESEAELAVERVRDGAVATSDGRYLVVQSFDAGEVDYTTEHVGGSFETRAGSYALISIRSAHEEPIPFAHRDWLERR